MNQFYQIMNQLSFLWESGKLPLLLLGLGLLIANLCWLFVFLFYGAVQVYNLQEGKHYIHLDNLWIERKRGQYTLHIPRDVIDRSVTTRYKIRTGWLFARLHEEELLCIRFGKEYDICLPIEREMIAKNHVAT
ncbi:MAG: hypothetical protein IJP31_02480 [Lachnospiraceae bacterium]|nr:hypothetical protein [Lachnospiraceae bacterium]